MYRMELLAWVDADELPWGTSDMTHIYNNLLDYN